MKNWPWAILTPALIFVLIGTKSPRPWGAPAWFRFVCHTYAVVQTFKPIRPYHSRWFEQRCIA